MGANSKIEWTHHTFNPWTGCAKVSPGCAHCYAESCAKRSGVVEWGPEGTRRRTTAANWREPLKWNREAEQAGERRRVFCASLADVFEDREELKPWRVDLFALIQATPHLDWLLLTKRPENAAPFLHAFYGGLRCAPWKNVWLGTSVENQETAEERIPHLIEAPAVVRFLSCEPLLEAVDLRRYLLNCVDPIDWVIVGGESGHGARPCNVKDVLAIVRQCRAAGVATFVKQLGAKPWLDGNHPECNRQLVAGASEAEKRDFAEGLGEYLEHCYTIQLNDPKGGDWDEWPESLYELFVRNFPTIGV